MTKKQILSRIGQAVIVLLVTYTVAFLLLSALPSDAVQSRYGDPSLGLSQAEIDAIREDMGVDQPLVVQYFTSLVGFLTGNFGNSTQTGAPVAQLIADALPHTLALAACAIGLAIIVALLLAFLATLPGSGAIGTFARSLPSFLVSLPGFWIGILLIQFFSFQLGWVRVIEPGTIEGLLLPTLTLAVPMTAPLTQVLNRSLEETQSQPFVQAVRARGASETWIFWKNVLRNSLLPVLTMVGLLFGELVGGAVVTETVFGRTGLGQMTAQAVANRDTPVLLAVVLIAATAYVIINLIVDLLYPVLDVRLRATNTENADKADKKVKA
ncbi:ABC-type dipeptide/oligopeptide/nickel transport system, permease component [Corynebacterium camporealensis]|uniref:ABC-type dipeptide/oligopeptide/nickel transport system, permease component n=1 Tax=Corynebacterium camporealensis TaxID=161896 RepID=A0A0F6QXT4_9CORY|nr:ABC transporter permease [Corynebacterium camporealensis]AKE39745.1 ABC-type dipeptide/oligopeptide/nickel transport system, permease component [Corynebacterium camporealensis]AVH88870.1 ABC-type dipeptide/oligopeptide/nickel transport system, permease component [Corynebacterium camporealensis]